MLDIEKIVDECRARFQPEYVRKLRFDLYPEAFANETSWLRVQNALDTQDEFTRQYVIEALRKIFEVSQSKN